MINHNTSHYLNNLTMKATLIILLVSLVSLVSCNKSNNYQPQGLKKLSHSEIYDRIKAGKPMAGKVIYKDTLGNIISTDDLYKMNEEEVFGDMYVNADNEVAEIVMRKATAEDKVFIAKIQRAFEEDEPVTLIDIDCSKIQQILEGVYENDQKTRQGGGMGDTDIDKKNQQIVVSIIENCGFPKSEKHGRKSVEAVFFVIQHAGRSLREKYFLQIEESAERGDLERGQVALMEDRILMDRGEKQKYGSQVQKINGSADWTLYPIEDPQNVNKRRAEVGLGPIEEYLEHFGIDYKTLK